MKRIIYHGTDHIIEKPLYGFGYKTNDYGSGFYCCSNKTLAGEWASKNEDVQGIVNQYEIRDDDLKILDLTKEPNNSVLSWIAILVHFRKLPLKLVKQCSKEIEYLEKNYYIDVSQYDVVIGYRADDNYFQFPQALLRSEILIESLEEIFRLGDLGKQYVLISEKAFSRIKYIKSFESDISNELYRLRVDNADKMYQSIVERDRYKKGTRMIDFVREK